MSFRDDLISILSGGLPSLLDDPAAVSVATPAVIRVEEIAPSGTFRDREPFLMGVTQNQVLIGTAGIIGVLALIMLVRR